MNKTPDRLIEIFNEALRLGPVERAAYLDRTCGADGELRQRVAGLLRAYEKSGEFMGDPVSLLHAAATNKPPPGEAPGDYIGPYKLLQQIGEGGCGVVFMAEQDAPIRRRVALKLVKAGMDTKSVIARFEAERQALALMDHPNIAKVFTAGATASGRPYFVMELIRGTKITDYCDQNSLPTEERLKLFVQVCQAVQHAHQKGIIHRDIKPSNILVTETLEGTALPVVIDFGVAKAVANQRLTDKTVFTAFEMLIGTPAYMSPEQAALTSVDVDTRSDVYSLGVLLYELLTGLTPFDTVQLLKAGLDEVRRVIREQEPICPSTRLSRMTDAELTKVAQYRQAEPPRLIKTVHGDLDWIVMRALEKDRTRRYETANSLAVDIKRFLANEVISARPPSKFYKFEKLLLRNKLLFLYLGIIALLLMVSLVVVSTSLRKERQAHREADAALEQARADKEKAETETAKSQQVAQFLEDMLQGVEPSAALGQDTTMLVGILDRTAERVGKEMTNQPAVEAELRGVIGRLYAEVGNYAAAEQMLLEALALRRKLSGAESVETAAALYSLGNLYRKQQNLAKGEAAFSEALAIQRRLLGNEHADVARTLTGLGAIYCRQRKLAEAESLTREGLKIRRKLFGNEHLEFADSLRNLSVILADLGRREESEKAAREVLDIRRQLLGNEHPLVAAALMDLAWAAGFNGKSPGLEEMETEAFTIRRKVLGDGHPEVAKSIYALGGRMRERGSLAESHAVLAAAFSIQRKLLGPDHPDVLATLRSLGATLELEGQWAEAEIVHREALEAWRRLGGSQDPSALAASEGLAHALTEQRKYAEAERHLNETLTPEFVQQPASVNLLMKRVEILSRQQRWREAAADAAIVVQLRPSDHYRYHQLAGLLAISGNRSAYETLCRKILVVFGETKDPYVAERMAGDCLLLPDSGVDLKQVDELATRAVELGQNEGGLSYFQACKALSEYRLENYSKAIEWADKSIAAGDPLAKAKGFAVRAMAQGKLREWDAARVSLTNGNELAPSDSNSPSLDLGNSWLAWVCARLALDEATALIQPSQTVGQDSGKP
jgi:eukaryotic-like serine/threonine-protein kinase